MAEYTSSYLPLKEGNSSNTSCDVQETIDYSVLQTINQPQPNVSLTQPIQGNTPTVTIQIKLGDTPMRLVCPCCRSEIITKLIIENTEETWTRFKRILCWCPLLCFCCAILSCCCKSTKNFRHECPQCQVHLGTYKPRMH